MFFVPSTCSSGLLRIIVEHERLERGLVMPKSAEPAKANLEYLLLIHIGDPRVELEIVLLREVQIPRPEFL